MSGLYFFGGFILEKCGNLWKNGRFSGRIWPDWGNTARADMAGLGSIGLNLPFVRGDQHAPCTAGQPDLQVAPPGSEAPSDTTTRP